jgi:hypothetical protein
MGARIIFIAGIAFVFGTVLFVNTPEGQRWLKDRVQTVRRITSEVQPPSATAAPYYPDNHQTQKRSTR